MMKNFWNLLLPLAIVSCASANTFDLGAHGKLSISVPKNWTAAGRDMMGRGHDVRIVFEKSPATTCRLTFIYAPKDRKRDRKKSEAAFRSRCARFVDGSVEKKVVLHKFKLKEGYGFYATFTDRRLVGKPAVPGDFKTMTSGLVDLSADIVVAVTLLADDASSLPFKQAIGMVESILVEKKKEK